MKSKKNKYNLPDGVGLEWFKYRQQLLQVYRITQDIFNYSLHMFNYQSIIKAFMKKKKLTLFDAVNELCKGELASNKIKFISAGYELHIGKDFTKNEE